MLILISGISNVAILTSVSLRVDPREGAESGDHGDSAVLFDSTNLPSEVGASQEIISQGCRIGAIMLILVSGSAAWSASVLFLVHRAVILYCI